MYEKFKINDTIKIKLPSEQPTIGIIKRIGSSVLWYIVYDINTKREFHCPEDWLETIKVEKEFIV